MTYLKPSDLTAEERAIVDHEASRFHRDWTAEARYKTAFDICKSFILARRALFAPPASEEKVTCPNCLQKVPSELEHYHSGYHDDNYTVEPHYVCEQQISELDDRHNRMVSPEYQAKVKAEMARRAVEIGGDRLVGVSYRPVSETVAVGTWQLEELLKYADLAEVALRTGFHPPEFLFRPADRSLRQVIDAVKKQRDEQRTHAQPVGDGDLAEMFHRGFVAGEKNAHAQPRPKLEKTRRALKCGQERLNIVFLSEETTTRWNNLFYEALAELDAAEGVEK